MCAACLFFLFFFKRISACTHCFHSSGQDQFTVAQWHHEHTINLLSESCHCTVCRPCLLGQFTLSLKCFHEWNTAARTKVCPHLYKSVTAILQQGEKFSTLQHLCNKYTMHYSDMTHMQPGVFFKQQNSFFSVMT